MSVLSVLERIDNMADTVKSVQLKDSTGENINPVTNSSLVFNEDGTSLVDNVNTLNMLNSGNVIVESVTPCTNSTFIFDKNIHQDEYDSYYIYTTSDCNIPLNYNNLIEIKTNVIPPSLENLIRNTNSVKLALYFNRINVKTKDQLGYSNIGVKGKQSTYSLQNTIETGGLHHTLDDSFKNIKSRLVDITEDDLLRVNFYDSNGENTVRYIIRKYINMDELKYFIIDPTDERYSNAINNKYTNASTDEEMAYILKNAEVYGSNKDALVNLIKIFGSTNVKKFTYRHFYCNKNITSDEFSISNDIAVDKLAFNIKKAPIDQDIYSDGIIRIPMPKIRMRNYIINIDNNIYLNGYFHSNKYMYFLKNNTELTINGLYTDRHYVEYVKSELDIGTYSEGKFITSNKFGIVIMKDDWEYTKNEYIFKKQYPRSEETLIEKKFPCVVNSDTIYMITQYISKKDKRDKK